MQLSDRTIRALRPREKPYKMTDGNGLYLLVTKVGGRLWRYDYRFQGKRQTLSLGQYPDLGLAAARQTLSEARQALAEGRDPMTIKRSHKPASGDTFGKLADDWLQKRIKEGLAAPTVEKLTWFIELAKPDLSHLPIKEIGTAEILRVLRQIEARERYHSAKRLRTTLSRIFKYGIAAGRADRDPAADLSEALTSIPVKSRAAVTTEQGLSGVLRSIQGYEGAKETRIGLLLLIHLFCRPGELRRMEWVEVDLDKRLWSIPGPKMKMRQPHTVPLSSHAVALLEELHTLTSRSTFCFPSIRSPLAPMSENTLNAALRRLGYTKEELCSHGFRATASTLLNESGRFNPDAIEAQLAHRPRGGGVRAAYLRGEFFEERVQMMNWWSEYLESLTRS